MNWRKALSSQFCVIIADGINDTQRSQIQAAVESKAGSWWHQMSDAWLVEGDLTPGGWLNLISVIVPHTPSQILIIGLPSKVMERSWATSMATGNNDWIKEHYAGGPSFNNRAKRLSLYSFPSRPSDRCRGSCRGGPPSPDAAGRRNQAPSQRAPDKADPDGRRTIKRRARGPPAYAEDQVRTGAAVSSSQDKARKRRTTRTGHNRNNAV